MSEPMCECGHDINCHYSAGCLRYEDDVDADQCKCPQFTDTRIVTLCAQLAAIRPAFEKLLEYAKAEEAFRPEDAQSRQEWLIRMDILDPQRREALALAEKVEVKE